MTPITVHTRLKAIEAKVAELEKRDFSDLIRRLEAMEQQARAPED